MATEIPVPVHRSPWRLRIGQAYFRVRREASWLLSSRRYANRLASESELELDMPFIHMRHATPLYRDLRNVKNWMDENKAHNLRLAVSTLHGAVLEPGETLSLWRRIGRPSAKRGYRPGMILVNGEMRTGVGGGLCQLSNLVYWMTLHTPLTVTERYRHQYDVFPDANRTVPFGSGATIAYNYIDLQIRNDTDHRFVLALCVSDTHLCGEWRCDVQQQCSYRVVERDHRITQLTSGVYVRHNALWRVVSSPQGDQLREEWITENHSLMMYSPMLPS